MISIEKSASGDEGERSEDAGSDYEDEDNSLKSSREMA